MFHIILRECVEEVLFILELYNIPRQSSVVEDALVSVVCSASFLLFGHTVHSSTCPILLL